MMRRGSSVVVTLGVIFACLSSGFAAKNELALTMIRRSVQAMGGEKVLRGLHSLEIKGIGHRYMREQSERPEGPWLLDYFQISEERDLDGGRIRRETKSRGCDSTECWKSTEWASSTLIIADHVAASLSEGKTSAGRASAAQLADESLVLAPDRALLLALEATDLQNEPDISFHGFTHHVVSFGWHGSSIKILLSGYTNLPSAVEVTRSRPYEVYWSPWGDVTTRVSYEFWMLESGGMHYPREWDYETNGQPDWAFMVNELTLNPTTNDDDFRIPEEVKEDFMARKLAIEDWPLGAAPDQAQEVAPGIVLIPGRWNITEVRQPDGIVILEGPISNQYSALVIADAQKRFPGLKIKGVVTTSDAWPHIGGLREYVARGIPIYALDLNRSILQRLLVAPHSIHPDALALHPKAARVEYVSKRSQVGTGSNAFDLIPMRTVTGERQMVVYFPGQKVLYSSDAFQRGRSGEFFLPQTLSEIVDVARREKLEVMTDVGMHIGPTSWKEIEDAVVEATNARPKTTNKLTPSVVNALD
jgi:hypothetical protein